MCKDPTDPTDRAQILARRRHFIALAMSSVALIAGSGGCTPCLSIFPQIQLGPGGVFVVHVHDPSCAGCSELEREDLIQAVDGRAVSTVADLIAAGLTDGQPHELTVWSPREERSKSVQLRVGPSDSMAPIEAPLPFWAVGAHQLDATPSWARRRLWGHAAPRLQLVAVERGGLINGRDLYGQRWLIVLFDWVTAMDRQNAALTLQVLQKSQADLRTRQVQIIFAHVAHPAATTRRPMDDANLREFFVDNQASESEGGPLPPPPLYRMPNKTEDDPRTELGLEGEQSYLEVIAEAPNILVLDEYGVIRWHSAGPTPDPIGAIAADMVYTINEAVLFARDQL